MWWYSLILTVRAHVQGVTGFISLKKTEYWRWTSVSNLGIWLKKSLFIPKGEQNALYTRIGLSFSLNACVDVQLYYIKSLMFGEKQLSIDWGKFVERICSLCSWPIVSVHYSWATEWSGLWKPGQSVSLICLASSLEDFQKLNQVAPTRLQL